MAVTTTLDEHRDANRDASRDADAAGEAGHVLAGLPDEAVIARLRSVEQRRRELEAEQAAVLAEVERRRLHANDAHATMWGLLRSSLGWSTGECRSRMRVARLVATFPDVGEWLADGRVPVAHVTEIARGFANPRCGDRIGDVIGTLVHAATRLEYDEMHVLVRRWETLADTDGAHREFEAGDAARTAHAGVFDGVGHLAARFGAADGAEIVEIVERFHDAEVLADWEAARELHGDDAGAATLPRTDAQRRADAVLAIFRTAAGAPPGTRLPEPTLVVLADHLTFEDALASVGLFPAPVRDEPGPVPLIERRCETATGVPVDPALVAKLALQAHVRRLVYGSDGAIVDHGRRQRLFRGAARQAVMLQATRCIHPGCRVRVGNCQADHIEQWARDGGETRPDNGAPLCRRHNLAKNRGYTTRRDSLGRWRTYRPDGTEIC